MESPAATPFGLPGRASGAARGRARAGCPFLLWRDPAGQRILALDASRARSPSAAAPRSTSRLDADEQVSRLHAEIERIGGEWTVADDGLSRNGSFLNGERVSRPAAARDGDELRFGDDDRRLPGPAPAARLGDRRRARGAPRRPS